MPLGRRPARLAPLPRTAASTCAARRRLQRMVAARGRRDHRRDRGMAAEMRALDPRGPVEVIENGCDFDDFDGLEYRRGDRFRITHTGGFIWRRDARPFFEALAQAEARPGRALRRRLPRRRRAAARRARPRRPPRGDPVPAARQGATRCRGTRTRCCSCSPSRARRGARSSRPRSTSTSPRAGRSWPRCRRTGRPRRSSARPAPASSSRRPTSTGWRTRSSDLERRWRDNELVAPELSEELRAKLSRRERAERLAEILRKVA